MTIRRAIIIVLDSLGVGELPDADIYGDIGSDTLQNIYNNTKMHLPNLRKLGLFNIDGIKIPDKVDKAEGAFGKAAEQCAGKNSPVGHWEIAGYINRKPFNTYPNAFPKELIEEFIKETGLKEILANEVGSGTELLKKYGEEHIKTGFPIVYTSADSVFQIAAHECIIPVTKLYEICKIARKIADKPQYNIGTIIARPFIGKDKDNFERTYNRKDFEATSFGRNMLDIIKENQMEVIAIGKIEDLFSGRGITKSIHTTGNEDGIEKSIEQIKADSDGLIFSNLVDFDMLYGHRNDVNGYARALEYLDSKLPEIINTMKETDMLIITADHGCDPTTQSTDHSREYVPILIKGKYIKPNVNLGVRKTYADIAATILDLFEMEKLKDGISFKNEIFR